LPFTFVTEVLDGAIDDALVAARPNEVFVMGGGDVIRQCVVEV
jgi:dihydrofolate reductase